MSDLVDFEDLDQLDGGDLRAVFGQVTLDRVLAALAGTSAAFRHHLLAKYAPSSADQIEAQVAALGTISIIDTRNAQRDLVEALCRLSRGGQVAFDDPADMVA